MLRNLADASIKEIYKILNKIIQHEVSVHKSKLLNQKNKQLEDDYAEKKCFDLFKMVRELDRKPKKSLNMVIDKNGNKQANINKALKIWKEYFE